VEIEAVQLAGEAGQKAEEAVKPAGEAGKQAMSTQCKQAIM
jgi:hypothetical protein